MAGLALSSSEQRLDRIVLAIQGALAGRSNAVGEVTLTAGVALTTVTADNCGADSKVFLFPRSANAAAALATTYVAAADVSKGQFIIRHANAGSTDRTFSWVCLG